MHDALSRLFNLVDGVYPGIGAGQDLVYVLEKRGRQQVVSAPVKVEGRAVASLKTSSNRWLRHRTMTLQRI
jgi:hypothetical protein